jgi:chemotaxis signal transduction protein
MIPGFVLFRLGRRRFVLRLGDVREIVRLTGLEPLPGTRPPLAGVIVLRGRPLPVLDIRAVPSADGGDVLVMDVDGDLVGVAVDQVVAVLSDAELPESGDAPSKTMPSYVTGVRRGPHGPVLVVDLPRLLDACAEGWVDSLADVQPVAASQ